jgi:hypothetical protein
MHAALQRKQRRIDGAAVGQLGAWTKKARGGLFMMKGRKEGRSRAGRTAREKHRKAEADLWQCSAVQRSAAGGRRRVVPVSKEAAHVKAAR